MMAAAWWRVSPAIGEAAARVLIYRIGPDYFVDRVLVAWTRSDAPAHDESWRALATMPQRWTAPVFPLRAADFIARGVAKGPALGAALGRAEEAWIAAGFPLDAATLAGFIDGALRR